MQAQHPNKAARLAQALAGTEHLNPGLQCTASQAYYNNKPLRVHAEGLQLFFKTEGCLPGLQHYKVLTPHAISSGAKLGCTICLQQETFVSEQYMTRALQQAGLDQHVVLQWQPTWWHGRVDYYFPAAGIVMQVDGTAHFVANPRTRQLSQLLEADLRCNVAAWQAGFKLIRVHHEDQLWPNWRALLAAMATTPGPLLLLSPSFGTLGWKHHHTTANYVDHMHTLLPNAAKMKPPHGYSCFYPLTR